MSIYIYKYIVFIHLLYVDIYNQAIYNYIIKLSKEFYNADFNRNVVYIGL